jgi:uncharacterized FAD-dependent dehydrogenase
VLASGEQLRADHVVLALGHSARDTFAMLHSAVCTWRPSPSRWAFASSTRKGVIDRARFGPNAGHPILGAADYKLVHHASNGRAVYSFCMCPGGTVVAATSEPDRVVTNGMSQYSRNERNANAGIVVGISPQDYRQDGKRRRPGQSAGRHGLPALLGEPCLRTGRRRLPGAPAQLVGDFIKGQRSSALGSVEPSYKPGVHLTDLAAAWPRQPARLCAGRHPRGAAGLRAPDQGLLDADAVLTGVETRTSSPLRITRGRDYQSLNVKGLYPAGEGAGYAGGIMSAGVDGIEVAEALGALLVSSPLLVVMVSLAGNQFSWKLALLSGLVLTLGSWVVFIWGLGLTLPVKPVFFS